MDNEKYNDRASAHPPELSVIIVNYNAGEHLLTCVRTLVETTRDISLELILVDNASTDGSMQKVTQTFPTAHVYLNSENEGFAAACNQGIRAAHGESILLLNPDTIILPNAVRMSLSFLHQTAEAGIVGCRLLDQAGGAHNSCRSFPTVWDYFFDSLYLTKLFPKSKLFGRFYLTNVAFDGPTEVDMVQGAFFMIKRALLDDIGTLDERFFMYAEERDYCYRAKATGWKVFFLPQAKIIHVGRVSTRQHSADMLIEQRRSTILFHQKHDPRWKARLIQWILFLGTAIRSLIWNVVAIIKYTPSIKSKQHGYTAATRWFFQSTRRPKVSTHP